MPLYQAKFRIILKQDIEAPSKESAEVIARQLGKQAYLGDKIFEYVGFAGIEEKLE